MPNPLVKNIAKRTGKSVEEIEDIWKDAKKDASDKFDKQDDHYWGYVTRITERRAGLKDKKEKKD